MGKRCGLRFVNGLPRGGLGHLGIVPAVGSVVLSLFVRAELAVLLCLAALPICIWSALGLRRDDAAGEVLDHYEDGHSYSLSGLLFGELEHPVRRRSNGIIALAVLGLGIAACRFLFS